MAPPLCASDAGEDDTLWSAMLERDVEMHLSTFPGLDVRVDRRGWQPCLQHWCGEVLADLPVEDEGGQTSCVPSTPRDSRSRVLLWSHICASSRCVMAQAFSRHR